MAQKTILVGITGGIGAGKSAVAALYTRMGYPVFSADTLAREIVEPGEPALDEIKKAFGENSVLEDGFTLNRAWLREKIAHDPEARKQLEAITHPRIQQRFKQLAGEAAEGGARIVFYEAPLLFEAKSENNLDAVITVHADDETRIQRTMKRDGISRELAEMLLKSQMPQEEKMKRAQFLIENNGDEKALKNLAFAVLGQLRKKLGEKKPIPKKLIFAAIGIALVILVAWSLAFFVSDVVMDSVPEPESRVKAKEILRTAANRANAYRAQHGKFPENPSDVFGEGGNAVCEHCLSYVLALQAPCEANEGEMRYSAQAEKELADDLAGSFTAIKQSLDSLTLPCKEGAAGFNIYAAGMESPTAPMDILSIDEAGEIRVIQDGVGGE